MIPLNKAERSKAFLNFLILFLITIAVIVSTLLFSFQVPFKENDKLRKEMDAAETEKVLLQSFEIKMHETMNLLDTVNLSKNVYPIDKKIEDNLKSMTSMLHDSIEVNGICNKIVDNLRSLQVAKSQLRTVNNNSAELEARDRKILKLENDNNACQQQVIMLLSRSQN